MTAWKLKNFVKEMIIIMIYVLLQFAVLNTANAHRVDI